MRRKGKKYLFLGIAVLIVIAGVLAINLGEVQFSPPYTDAVSKMVRQCDARHSGAFNEIYTCEDFKDIESNLRANYKLMNDLDCDFEPIALRNGEFKGLLDGQGHTITYTYSSDTHGQIGLFSDIGLCGTVRDLLVNADVSGTGSVGAVAGYVYKGVIERTRSTGFVSSSGSDVGGLVGGLKSGVIVDSYSNAVVSGDNRVGGLVGAAWNFPNNEQRPIIKNTYSNSIILGEGNDVGGLIGLCDYSPIGSYWNLDYYSLDNGCGIGKPDEEMILQDTFLGWNFDETWKIKEGNDFPRLEWEYTPDGSRYLEVRFNRDITNTVSLRDITTGQELCAEKREGDYCYIDDKRIKVVEINYETFSRNATFEIFNQPLNVLYEYGESGNHMILPDYDGFPRERQIFNVYDKEGGLMETWTWAWSDGQPWLQNHAYYYGNHSFKVDRSPRDAFLLDITVNLKEGPEDISVLYGDGIHFTGTGRGRYNRLATSGKNTIAYVGRDASGNNVDEAFILR